MKAASYPLAREQDFTSRVNGRVYRVRVATPYGPPPEMAISVRSPTPPG